MTFALNDWLGTKRVSITPAGVVYGTFASLPYGDGLTSTGTDSSAVHFTGKERDAESGLDDFGARYYGSNMGRWMSPDWSAKTEPVPYANLGDPQSLNLYAYVRGNPVGRADLDGHIEDMGDFFDTLDNAAWNSGAKNLSDQNAALAAKEFARGQAAAQAEDEAISSGDEKKAKKIVETTWGDTRAVKQWYSLAKKDRDTLYDPASWSSGNVDLDFIKARYNFEFAKAAQSLFTFAEDFISTATSATGDPETVLGRLTNLGISEAKYGTDLAKGGYKASFSQQVREAEQAYISAAATHSYGVEKGWWPADQ
ncbi:RHS repeat-associated core domain-containing protein [Granulicella aggregans]|uniref:RHS repeat-associated core domain-containing protein n=1 Tax=Granulicella aggregans TaxID=474949 RepID=UPI0021E0876F|nr:RHS repeat-associated core domain-containing protein [Granulicella aggregans]